MNINYKQIAQIILNIAFVSSIIGVLYFTYGKNVEKLIVQDQSEYIAQTMGSDIKMFFPADIRQSIVSNLTVPDMSKADAERIITTVDRCESLADINELAAIVGAAVTLPQ